MKFNNDFLIFDTVVSFVKKYRKGGDRYPLVTKIEEIESRLNALEAKKGPGRPRRAAND